MEWVREVCSRSSGCAVEASGVDVAMGVFWHDLYFISNPESQIDIGHDTHQGTACFCSSAVSGKLKFQSREQKTAEAKCHTNNLT